MKRAHRLLCSLEAGCLAVLALVALAPGRAQAVLCGTFIDPLTITVTDIDFGDYSPGQTTDLVPTGTITLACQVPLDVTPSFTVALSAGVGGGFSPRKMLMGSNALNYNIYTTATPTTVWGDGTAGTSTQVYTNNVLTGSVSFTVYANLPAGQFVAPGGPYSDQIVVTVTY